MSSNSDSGHAMNVANFNELISFVTGYGETYNPSNNLIKLPAMQEVAGIAAEVMAGSNAAFSVYKNAISAREMVFEPLSGRVTQVMNILKASGVPKVVYDQVNTVARKIKGQRVSAIIKPEPAADGAEPVPVPKQISATQLSFDSRIENFGKLIQMLTNIPEYNPNENELKIEALTEFHDDLKAKNNAFVTAEVTMSNVRIARNQVLYTEITGLCDVGQTSKNYVKAIFGATSPQFKQISKIQFKKIK